MLWSIIGDIIGSIYEWDNIKVKDFPLFRDDCFFTDDSVLTIATAKVLIDKLEYDSVYREFTHLYPWRWYGTSFICWANDPNWIPYNSFGNGSAMRVWPIGYYFNTIEETLIEAKKSTEVTHNHPEWIKGAQAVACAIFLARKWNSQIEIKNYIEDTFGYNLSRNLNEIRITNSYNETCQWTVPEAITAFIESDSFEDAIRNAISIWWDSDTIACITWWIAEAYYGDIPIQIKDKAFLFIPEELKTIIDIFYKNIWRNKK